MRDVKFLKFFYQQLRPNNSDTNKEAYPFVSLCGNETNFVAPIDPVSALGFTDIFLDGNSFFDERGPALEQDNKVKSDVSLLEGGVVGGGVDNSNHPLLLLYAGGSLFQEFEPALLVYSSSTGRLYYPLSNHKYLGIETRQRHPNHNHNPTLGLLHPYLAQHISKGISTLKKRIGNSSSSIGKNDNGDVKYVLCFRGCVTDLNVID